MIREVHLDDLIQHSLGLFPRTRRAEPATPYVCPEQRQSAEARMQRYEQAGDRGCCLEIVTENGPAPLGKISRVAD